MSESGKQALLLVAIVVCLVLVVQPNALAALAKRPEAPRRVLSEAEMQLFTTTANSGEIVMVGANGVLIDQGSQSLRVGTSHITAITNSQERLRIENNGLVFVNDGLSFHVGADNQNSIRLHHINNNCYLDYGLGSLEIRHSTATGIDNITMSFLANGNVGIGNTDSTHKLSINQQDSSKAMIHTIGKYTATGSTYGYQPILVHTSGGPTSYNNISAEIGITPVYNGSWVEGPAARMSFKLNSTAGDSNSWGWAANTEVMTLNGWGNVGIGTTNPICSLNVVNDGGWFGRIENKTTNASYYSMFSLANDSDTGGGCYLFLNSTARTEDGGANNATLRNDRGDLILASRGSQGMRIVKDSGNVGIGTTNPASTLHVRGGMALFRGSETLASEAGSRDYLCELGTSNSSISGGLRIYANRAATGSDWTTTSISMTYWVDVTQFATLSFYQSSMWYTGNMVISRTGEDSFPSFNLRSDQTAKQVSIVSITKAGSGVNGSLVGDGLIVAEQTPGDGSKIHIGRRSNYNATLSIVNNGNVGIGTTNPSHRLQIDQGLGNSDNGLRITNSNYGSDQYLNISMMYAGFYSYAKLQGVNTGVSASTPIVIQPDGGYTAVGTSAPYDNCSLTINTNFGIRSKGFKVGGTRGTYYKVRIVATDSVIPCKFTIGRTIHLDGDWTGSMNFTAEFRGNWCGTGSGYEEYKYHIFNYQPAGSGISPNYFVAKATTNQDIEGGCTGSIMWVYLNGNTNYYFTGQNCFLDYWSPNGVTAGDTNPTWIVDYPFNLVGYNGNCSFNTSTNLVSVNGNYGLGAVPQTGVPFTIAGPIHASGVHRSYRYVHTYHAGGGEVWNPGDPTSWPWAGTVFYITFRGHYPFGSTCIRGHFLVFHSRWLAGHNSGGEIQTILAQSVALNGVLTDGGMSFVFNSPNAQDVEITILVVSN